MRIVSLAVVAAALAACGGSSSNKDSGVDTSCGFDCAAQQRFGLIAGRCFEYTDTGGAVTPPSLGVKVLPLTTLEQGFKVIQLEYRQTGQPKMLDSFAIKGDALVHVRREATGGQTTTYLNASNELTGVTWLTTGATGGETFTTQGSAQVSNAPGNRVDTNTTYTMSTNAASPSQLSVPLKKYDNGIEMLVAETPEHFYDPQRIFVPDVGFVRFTTTFGQSGSSVTYRLQAARDLKLADGGMGNECGNGG